jgi:hypothetical protein
MKGGGGAESRSGGGVGGSLRGKRQARCKREGEEGEEGEGDVTEGGGEVSFAQAGCRCVYASSGYKIYISLDVCIYIS